MKNQTFISIDMGGSRAEAVFFNLSAGSASRMSLSSLNLRMMTDLELGELLHKIGAEFVESGMPEPCTLLVGAAGCKGEPDRLRIERLLSELRLPISSIRLYSDFEANHAAAMAGTDGITSINGTGSIIYGTCGKESLRHGGWGYLLDETPSAAAFGRWAFQSICAYMDGEKQYEAVFRVICSMDPAMATKKNSIIDLLYSSGNVQKILGSLAPFLTHCFDEKIALVTTMVEKSFERWATAINITAMKLNLPEPVKYCGIGGLWENWPAFSECADKALKYHSGKTFERVKQALPLYWGPFIRHLLDQNLDPSDFAGAIAALAL